jgi:transposase
MSRGTVRTYAYADTFPEWSRHPRPPSILDPYLSYLEKRHAEGCENASRLWREIQAQGFSGKRWQVLKWMKRRRLVLSPHTPDKTRKRPVKEVAVETQKSVP